MLRVSSLVVLLALATGARAAPTEGVIMQVADKEELFVNLGRKDGLAAGTRLQIFRRVVLEHPITKKPIEDRFPIGVVTVAEAGTLLSIVRSYDDLRRPPVAGDYAVVWSAPRVAQTPTPRAAPVECPAVPTGPVAPSEPPALSALDDALRNGLGKPIGVRILLLKAWRKQYPTSRHVKAVAASIQQLEAMQTVAVEAPPTLIARHDQVTRVEAQRPLAIAIAVRSAKPIEAVRLLARRKGDPRWITTPLAQTGIDHYAAPFPPALLHEPGDLRYAIEVVHGNGQVEAVAGTLMKPHKLTVEALPAGDAPPGPSHASFEARYVDFNSVGDGADAYFQTEARFRYGVRWRALRSVEVGVGLISGEGGSVLDLAEGLPSDPTSLGYAFAAFELGLGELFGVGARIISGNRRVSDDTLSRSAVGSQLHVRIGEEEGMRLLAGMAIVSELGSRYYGEFHAQINERLPFTALIEATNLPVSADYGARGVGALGWKANDWLTLRGELGLNVRTIKHYGYTVGGGLSFDWE